MKLLKFSASWCGPCKTLEKNLDGFNLVEIQHIDIEEETEMTAEYGIHSIPTLILVDDDGKTLWRNSGTMTADDLTKVINQFNAK